jgi:hypothetical protein
VEIRFIVPYNLPTPSRVRLPGDVMDGGRGTKRP